MVNEIEVQKQKIYTGFLVDIELSVRKDSDDQIHLWVHSEIASLILGHVMHKNKNLREPCRIIFGQVVDHFLGMKSSSLVSNIDNCSRVHTITGYHFQADYHFATDVIYEMLNFEGILDGINENKQSIYIQYSIKFLLTPAIDRVWAIYDKKGYKRIVSSRKFPEEVMEKIDSEKDFDHKEIWKIICMKNIEPST